jgi:hypothetical protein
MNNDKRFTYDGRTITFEDSLGRSWWADGWLTSLSLDEGSGGWIPSSKLKVEFDLDKIHSGYPEKTTTLTFDPGLFVVMTLGEYCDGRKLMDPKTSNDSVLTLSHPLTIVKRQAWKENIDAVVRTATKEFSDWFREQLEKEIDKK